MMNNKFSVGFGSLSDSDDEKKPTVKEQKKPKAQKEATRKPATAA